jgi:hypothetical protein
VDSFAHINGETLLGSHSHLLLLLLMMMLSTAVMLMAWMARFKLADMKDFVADASHLLSLQVTLGSYKRNA